MRAIAIIGMPGSGKEEVLQVAMELGIHVVRMGDLIREKASQVLEGMDDGAIGDMATRERKEHGPGVWAECTLPKLLEPMTVIDGIRSMAELEVYQDSLGKENVSTIGLHTSPGTRFERVLSRGRSDASQTREGFDARDRRELSWGLGDALALCDHMIINEGTLDELRGQAREVLEGIPQEIY